MIKEKDDQAKWNHTYKQRSTGSEVENEHRVLYTLYEELYNEQKVQEEKAIQFYQTGTRHLVHIPSGNGSVTALAWSRVGETEHRNNFSVGGGC